MSDGSCSVQKNGNNKKIKLAAVVGPTASGKTALSVELARRFSGEVVSCDSMQVYSELKIATARPDEEEMRGVAHHLLGYVSLDEEYSVARYVEDATAAVKDITSRGKLPVLCGGTGLYYTSFVDSVGFSPAAGDEAVRQKYREIAEGENGRERLLGMLSSVDPKTAAKLHPNDTGRIIRALEVYELTGVTQSEYARLSRTGESRYDLCVIGLRYPDRAVLYDRINRRVDKMIKDGLLGEVESVISSGKFGKTASQAIGVKEFLPYFKGEATLDECTEILKRNTRRYAKRQMTWFNRDERICWIDVMSDTDFNEISEKAEKIMEKFVSVC